MAAVQALGALGKGANSGIDDLGDLAARLFQVPVALVSLASKTFQEGKGCGCAGAESPDTEGSVSEPSFCHYTMRSKDVLVVCDALHDPRFASDKTVTGPPFVRFCAGVPLVTSKGYAVGALILLDSKPRPQGLSALEVRTLTTLADQVVSQLELDLAAREQEVDRAALAASDARFNVIADAMPQMVWSTLPDGFHDYYNARWYEFTGVEPGSTDGEGWNGMFHPEDQARAQDLWHRSLNTGEPYEIEYRLRRHDGVFRWTLGRAVPLRNAQGQIVRWFGTCTDIDDLKRVEQGQALLSQELSHRIKNIFAVISALIALSARKHPEAKSFAQGVRNRIAALAHAHEFVRPHSEVSRPLLGDMTLHAFLSALFRPYASLEGRERVILAGDDALFDDQAATSVALLFHELATNAAKYGSLSAPGGRVELTTCLADDRFVLSWREAGGPRVQGPPEHHGFGSSLATLSVEGQLGGRLERVWHEEGLEVTAVLPATALSRRKAAQKRSTDQKVRPLSPTPADDDRISRDLPL